MTHEAKLLHTEDEAACSQKSLHKRPVCSLHSRMAIDDHEMAFNDFKSPPISIEFLCCTPASAKICRLQTAARSQPIIEIDDYRSRKLHSRRSLALCSRAHNSLVRLMRRLAACGSRRAQHAARQLDFFWRALATEQRENARSAVALIARCWCEGARVFDGARLSSCLLATIHARQVLA